MKTSRIFMKYINIKLISNKQLEIEMKYYEHLSKLEKIDKRIKNEKTRNN